MYKKLIEFKEIIADSIENFEFKSSLNSEEFTVRTIHILKDKYKAFNNIEFQTQFLHSAIESINEIYAEHLTSCENPSDCDVIDYYNECIMYLYMEMNNIGKN